MATSLKIDDELKSRVQHLASMRDRSTKPAPELLSSMTRRPPFWPSKGCRPCRLTA